MPHYFLKLKTVLCLFYFLSITTLLAQQNTSNNQATPEWIVSTDFVKSSRGTCIAIDSLGNSYSSGFFSDKMWLEDSLFVDSCGAMPFKGKHHFLSKRDQNGQLIWMRYGTGSTRIHKILLDKSGHIYTLGYVYRNTLQLSSINDSIISRHKPLPSTGDPHLFICQYDVDGKVIRTKIIYDVGSHVPNDCLFDRLGNLVIGGYYQYRSEDNPRMIRSSYSLIKLNKNWEIIWQQQGNPSSSSVINGITLDSSSNIYTIGSFTKAIHFGSNNTFKGNQHENRGFAAKYDTNGNFEWCLDDLTPTPTSYGMDIKCDKNQNILLLFNTQHSKSFVIKLNANHQKEWSKEIHGRQQIQGILLDDANHFYLFGQGYTGNFGNPTYSASNHAYDKYSFFIAKYNSYGNLLGLNIEGKNGIHSCNDIALYKKQLLVLGTYSSGDRKLHFGSYIKNTEWYYSIWVAVFNDDDFIIKNQDK